MNINGTLINYYFHCKRQCWLFGNRVNMENNSEDVHIGRALHEKKVKNVNKQEISIDNVKIDKITDQYLVEIKKSDSDREATKWQLLLYLYILKEKGIDKIGKIEYIEKKTKNSKIEFYELDEIAIDKLKELDKKIINLINDSIPDVKYEKKCLKCAYYEYCFI